MLNIQYLSINKSYFEKIICKIIRVLWAYNKVVTGTKWRSKSFVIHLYNDKFDHHVHPRVESTQKNAVQKLAKVQKLAYVIILSAVMGTLLPLALLHLFISIETIRHAYWQITCLIPIGKDWKEKKINTSGTKSTFKTRVGH